MLKYTSLAVILILVSGCRKDMELPGIDGQNPYYPNLQPTELSRWEDYSEGPDIYIFEVHRVENAIITITTKGIISFSTESLTQNWVLDNVAVSGAREVFKLDNYLIFIRKDRIVKIDFDSGTLIEVILIQNLFQSGGVLSVKEIVRDGTDLYIIASYSWDTTNRQFLISHYDLATEVHTVLYDRQQTGENPFRPVIYRPLVWQKAAQQLIIPMYFEDENGMEAGIYTFHPESRELRFRHPESGELNIGETISVILDDKYYVYQGPSRRLSAALIDEDTFTELFNDSKPSTNLHKGYSGVFSQGGSYFAFDHNTSLVQSIDIITGAVNWEAEFSSIAYTSVAIPNKKLMFSDSKRPERPGNIYGVQLIDLHSGQNLIEWFPEVTQTTPSGSFYHFHYLEEEHACIIASSQAIFKYALPELLK